MIEAKPHPHEHKRLLSLKAVKLLDSPLEERFERITRMVCRILNVPIAIFNLIDEDRQHYKSVQGLTNTDAAKPAAFCTHALNESSMLLVPDAHVDKRFFDNPFVTGEYLDVGFYAGCPVRTPDGMPIGTLCAIDTKPRDMSPEQLAILRDLASMVETELKLVSLTGTQMALIDELHAANHPALVDPLTRLWNRTGIIKLLEKEGAEAARRQGPLTIAMIGIDRFKAVNEAHGQATGDAVLREVARKILSGLRTEDSIGRFGGDEFLVIMAECLPEKAQESAERLCRLVAGEPVTADKLSLPVTISAGVATIPGGNPDYTGLIEKATFNLQKARQNGRNRAEPVFGEDPLTVH